MIKAIIFDVDGVLIDSNKIIVKAYQKSAKKLGMRVPSEKEILDLFGRPLEEILRILWPDTDLEVHKKEFRKMFMDKDMVIPRIDGAVDAVKKRLN